jgi:hypothetical protein
MADNLTFRHFVPKFNKDNTAQWFSDLDLTFQTFNMVNEQIKILTVKSAIPPELIPSTKCDTYDALKEAIVTKTTLSKTEIYNRLDNLTMGDRTPSQLFDHMRDFAKNEVDEHYLRRKWLDLLPADIAVGLADPDRAMDQLKRFADEAFFRQKKNTKSFSVNNIDIGKHPEDDRPGELAAVDKSENNILTLLSDIKKLLISQSNFQRPTGRADSDSGTNNKQFFRSNQHQPVGQNSHPGVCYYHNRFGRAANNCHGPPCPMFQKN